MSGASVKHRFPGVSNGWSRFDGPAGTQMVESAITAMSDWMRSGSTASPGTGPFPAAVECAELLDRTRAAVGRLLGAPASGIVFGANMTTLTFAFTRAIAQTLRPGDRIVGTKLDHDANITPWRRAAEQSGATHVLADFDVETGTLPPQNVIALIDEHTKWVTLPGASNLLGTAPDLAPIIDAAHAAGAQVYIDAVAWAPHHPIDVTALEADALATSPYKWYGPHVGVLALRPDLLESLPAFKVRPAPDAGPRRFETGMPNFEGIAGVEAAARFLLEEGMADVAVYEAALFQPLLEGLQSIPGVRVYGPQGMAGRTPTAAFTIEGISPQDASIELGKERIAVWDGHNYALEVVDSYGLAESGGVIRAGLSRYIEADDIQRLLDVVARLAAR